MNKKNKAIGVFARKKILNEIIKYISTHNYPPTVREIGELTGLKSPASVQHHLKTMLEEGVIETDTGIGCPRAIRVPGYEFVKKERATR